MKAPPPPPPADPIAAARAAWENAQQCSHDFMPRWWFDLAERESRFRAEHAHLFKDEVAPTAGSDVT